MKTEKNLNPLNGYIALTTMLVLTVAIVTLFIKGYSLLPVSLIVLWIFMARGLTTVSPNSSKVLLLFGAYKGSVKQSGLFWLNPFFNRTTISLKARNFESEKLKVNDKMGNPIMISIILVWRVNDTYKASFEVDSYEDFIKIQTDSAVRQLVGSFPYDHFEDKQAHHSYLQMELNYGKTSNSRN